MHAFYDSIPLGAEGSPLCSPLPGLRVLAAAGDDALAFLHGQLTQDVTGLPADAARLAGYCTARGRLLATLVMWRAAQGAEDDARLYALVRADLAEALQKRLSMFVLRAKAKLSLAALNPAGVQCDAGQLPGLQAAAGGELPRTAWQRVDRVTGTWIAAPSASGAALRWWWIASDAQLQQAGALGQLLARAEPALWQAADLAAGLPWIGSATQDLFIPQTVNLELAGGVSFTKGCYPGQEVVARSHYRGTVKRRMAYGQLQGSAGTDQLAGLDVYDAAQPGEPCGRVVDAAGHAGVSLLFETTLSSLPEGDLRLGAPDGPRIEVMPLPYALTAND
ncbi:aminomethyl transferase [Bordetella ansorpii]|uniref:Aminomethyl transferase n=1 Tax=Bordetella ansorpii TaxID=288768 RepID=A0A157SLG9_9BORD|nr:folate-binding protein YgfZ [Bordetella ansorpii]SAI71121.1 aminomethyl transferase [Bordetella ansorpii]